MKAAICFYGLVGSEQLKGGKGDALPPEIAHESYVRHIFSHQDCDVFIHTWSVEHESQLANLYRPKTMIAEPQRHFDHRWARIPSRGGLRHRLRRLVVRPTEVRRREIEAVCRARSRWYSNQQTLRLMEAEQRRTGRLYDCVMVTRLDVAFFREVRFADYDLSKFWASHWNDAPRPENNFVFSHENYYVGIGFLDLWFFSNPEYMAKFGQLFDHMGDYHPSPHRASYRHVRSFTDRIGYTLYRWQDHELVRRKFFDSAE